MTDTAIRVENLSKQYPSLRQPFDKLRTGPSPSTSSGQALRQAQGRPFDKLRAGPSTSSGQALRQAQGRPFDSSGQALRQAQDKPFDKLRTRLSTSDRLVY